MLAFLTREAARGYEIERMRPLGLVLAAALAGALTPAAASAAPSVTLNGVNIDGVTGQRFENCTVVIDERGDVHIQAKGYAVRTSGEEAPPPVRTQPAAPARAAVIPEASAPAPGKLGRRYFLATEQSEPDGTQYDVAIFVNAQWIREVKSSEPQVVMEVTKYLRPGPNKVVIAATKRIQGDRRSHSKDVTLKVVIGAGNIGGDHVMIDDPLIEMTRTAAEIEDRTQEYALDAR
jgi:hypothetical protein